MKKIEWLPHFETGVEEIDNEHRHLVGIVQDIYECIEKDDSNLSCALANKFIEKLSEHFSGEEKFLERIGYSDLEGHHDYHASVMTKTRDLERTCCGNNEPAKVAECYAAVMAILLDEIIRDDSTFKSYINHHGFSRPREPGDR
jgi:hemerythrin